MLNTKDELKPARRALSVTTSSHREVLVLHQTETLLPSSSHRKRRTRPHSGGLRGECTHNRDHRQRFLPTAAVVSNKTAQMLCVGSGPIAVAAILSLRSARERCPPRLLLQHSAGGSRVGRVAAVACRRRRRRRQDAN
uniref:Uncharacterized protein n=1 Tax=Steinernema glaseri TaxID=37863 RepID=A0A1I7YJK1_9BILA